MRHAMATLATARANGQPATLVRWGRLGGAFDDDESRSVLMRE